MDKFTHNQKWIIYTNLSGAICSILALIVSVWKNETIIVIVSLLGVLVFLSILAIFLYEYKKSSKTRPLTNLGDIEKRIEKICKENTEKSIYYSGVLNDKIINIFLKNIASEHIKKIIIISKDGNFKKDLLNYEKIVCKFVLGINFLNYLVSIEDKDNNSSYSYLFFWKKENRYYGIEIRNTDIGIFPDDVFEDNTCSINCVEQIELSKRFKGTLKELFKPFQQGYFEHVIPIFDDYDLRKKWRQEILKSFQAFGIGLLRKATIQERANIQITWFMNRNSQNDLNYFQDWLKNLHDLSTTNRAIIDRYFIIDKKKYFNENEYKSIVDHCIPILAKHENNNYRHFFVIKETLNSTLYQDDSGYDFSLYKIGKESTAQSSILDKTGKPFVLKVFFSKNSSLIKLIEKRFEDINSLEKDKDIFDKFELFQNSNKI